MTLPYVLGIDPGLRGVGLGVVDPAGTLVAATYARSGIKEGKGPAAWDGCADAVTLWVRDHLPAQALVVVEVPEIYKGGKFVGKGKARKQANPNDLLQLCGVLGAVCQGLRRRDGCVLTYAHWLPREWKGTLRGEAHNDATLAALTPAERTLVDGYKPASLAHNMLDGVGLARFQHCLMRTGYKVVDPRLQRKVPTRTLKVPA